MAHDVFISYSHKDKPTADGTCATLEARGIRCWIAPRDVRPGGDWSESIVTAINGARMMVLVFSAHANESVQIKREVERAVAKGIPIIPLRIEDVLPTKSLEYFLSTPHWLDAFPPPLERHLLYLADVVRQILDGKPAADLRPPAPPPLPLYRRREIMAAGGAAAAALAGLGAWAVLRPETPPSFVGKWQSKKMDIDPAAVALSTFGPESVPLGDILRTAFHGPKVTATLDVNDAGHYSYLASAEDHGTVSLAAGDNLTLTSAVGKKSVTAHVSVSPASRVGGLERIGGQPGDSLMLLDVPNWQAEFAGKPTGGIVGQWHTSLMLVLQIWAGDLTVAPDGTYQLKLARAEKGLFQIADGKWTATPSDGPPETGSYRFEDRDTVIVVRRIGSITFQRVK
jgi:hypothetical protein